MDDALVFIAKNKTVHKHLKIQATKKNPKNHLLHDMIEEVKIIPDAEENLWIHAGQTFSLTSVHFSIWMIVRVRCSMKARIHLALHQQFKLLVVWWSGGYFIGTVRLVSTEHHLNTPVYLSIVTDHVQPFMTTVHHFLMAASSSLTHHVTNLRSS